MKNPHSERLRIAARNFHRRKRGSRFEQGIVAPYAYDDPDRSRLTWWTDAVFIMNDYRVMLSWIHPRYVYDARIHEEASRRVAHLPFVEPATTPLKQRVGRSRRKTVGSQVQLANDARSETWKAQLALLNDEADYRIAPFIKSQWTQHCRMVELCVPMEVRSKADLSALVALTRRLLKREISLDDAFPSYLYTRENWRAERARTDDQPNQSIESERR